MSIIIKQATISDLPAILEIVNYEILNTTAIWDYEIRTIDQQTEIFNEKQKNQFPILVAILDNKVVGFGTYGTFRHKVGYRFTVEHSVYVHKDFHGKGIGSVILQELIVIAKKQNLRTIIGVIDSENKGSIAFHQKLGFEIVGHIKHTGFKFNRWLDSVFMQIILD
jgi:L-amino acid N-acyltransferase